MSVSMCMCMSAGMGARHERPLSDRIAKISICFASYNNLNLIMVKKPYY